MELYELLRIDSLEKNKFLKFILAVQFTILFIIGLDAIGLNIPILRQLIGFIYLTFVPGILIFRILKIRGFDLVNTLLFTVGLSITFIMLCGLFINVLYPIIGISNPLSTLSLTATTCVFILIFSIIIYYRDEDIIETHINQKHFFKPSILLPIIILLPALSVFGTYSMNYSDNNSFILLLIAIISIIIILSVLSKKFLLKDHYPFAILMISISLLYMISLINPYIMGWDIHVEYHFADLAHDASFWNSSIPDNVNAMLSIVILPIFYSNFLNLPIDQIFKIIYPLFFSLVPLGLYELYRKETGEIIAFISVCFFMSSIVFFGEMPQLCRQQIAELFLVLLIILIFNRKRDIDPEKKKILIILFSISLIVSHYGTSYIFIFYLLFGFALMFLFSNYTSAKPNNNLTLGVIILYIVMCLTWYIYVSGSSSFSTIVGIISNIYSSLGEFTSPTTRDPLILKRIFFINLTSLETIKIFLEFTTMLFIAIGIIKFCLIIKNKKEEYNIEFFSMALVSIAIIVMSIGLPYFAGYLNMSRLYFQALIIISPFFVFGGIIFFQYVLKKLTITIGIDTALLFVSLIVVYYLLFNTGFMFVVTGETKEAFTLTCLEKKGTSADLIYIYDEEISSAEWLSANINNDSIVFSDNNSKKMVLMSYAPHHDVFDFSKSTSWDLKDTFFYFRKLNTENKIIESSNTSEYNWACIDIQKTLFYKQNILNCNKIYDNGRSYIFAYPKEKSTLMPQDRGFLPVGYPAILYQDNLLLYNSFSVWQ